MIDGSDLFSGVTETPIIKIYTLIGVLIVRQFIFESNNFKLSVQL